MQALTVQSSVERVIAAAMNGTSSATRRAYESRIAQWLTWQNGPPRLDRENVKKYLRSMELRECSAQVQNQALAALKKLSHEAGELGWIDANDAAQILKIKSKKILGIRTGTWLSADQAKSLLRALNRTNPAGKRDGAVIALLLGCGLRRAEACSLETAQIQQIHGRTIIVNLVGKGNRIRSVAVPDWAAQLLEEWKKELQNGEVNGTTVLGAIKAMLRPGTGRAQRGVKKTSRPSSTPLQRTSGKDGIPERFLRSFHQDGTINGSLSPTAVRDIVMRYGSFIGVLGLQPHDLRRTLAKLSRLGGAPLETIQHSLGHSSLKTTALYLKTGEEANAGDFMRL